MSQFEGDRRHDPLGLSPEARRILGIEYDGLNRLHAAALSNGELPKPERLPTLLKRKVFEIVNFAKHVRKLR